MAARCIGVLPCWSDNGGGTGGGGGGGMFTIDTDIGSCDTSGMPTLPTLADATLAKAAPRLQQVRRWWYILGGGGGGGVTLSMIFDLILSRN